MTESDQTIEERIRERERYDQAKEVLEVLSKFVNNFNCPEEHFVEAFNREHRTLQQSMIGLMLKVMASHAEKPDTHIDARNEASRDTCRKMFELFEKEIGYKPTHMPCI